MTDPDQPVMLILRGIKNLLDEASALEYARRCGYAGRVLDVSGETGMNSNQVAVALKEFRNDPSITALYGFSGGGYNVRHIINKLSDRQKQRIRLLVVIGAPRNPESLYTGPWELVYRTDPPQGHMAGPKVLLSELGSGSQSHMKECSGRRAAYVGEFMQKFALGDHVRKRSGSSWHGRVCGFYSTTLTPDGVCVESVREPGAVQIYPAAALEYDCDE